VLDLAPRHSPRDPSGWVAASGATGAGRDGPLARVRPVEAGGGGGRWWGGGAAGDRWARCPRALAAYLLGPRATGAKSGVTGVLVPTCPAHSPPARSAHNCALALPADYPSVPRTRCAGHTETSTPRTCRVVDTASTSRPDSTKRGSNVELRALPRVRTHTAPARPPTEAGTRRRAPSYIPQRAASSSPLCAKTKKKWE